MLLHVDRGRYVVGRGSWPVGAHVLLGVLRWVRPVDGWLHAYPSAWLRVSSLPVSRLTGAQWLRIVRLMWGVDSAVHCTLDKNMREVYRSRAGPPPHRRPLAPLSIA